MRAVFNSRRRRVFSFPVRPAVEELDPRILPSTVQNFDVAGTGSRYTLTQYAGSPAATLVAGGPLVGGNFLRLTAAQAYTTLNTVDFDRTDTGAYAKIVADFDFRMTPYDTRADGLGFALASTANYGSTGPVAGVAEEPNLAGSLGIGFDIYRNDSLGDLVVKNFAYTNSISIHFNGAVLTQVDATPVVDMGSGHWIHARVIVNPGVASNPGLVSVLLSPSAGVWNTLIDHFPVPGLTPYEARVHFGARTGGETANHDLDNVRVQYLNGPESLFSFDSVAYSAWENKGSALLTVQRSGNTQKQATVNFVTQDGTAQTGVKFQATSYALTFAPGQTSQTVSVPLIDNKLADGDQYFQVALSNGGGGAVIGPAVAAVTIDDNETAAVTGHWSNVQAWPIVAIASSVLPTGKVLFWDRSANMAVWDPATNTFSVPPTPGFDGFCAANAFLADGRLVVSGGHPDEGDNQFDGDGLINASAYNPWTNTWTALPDMNAGRWYPSSTALANGDMVVLSGSETPGTVNTLPQVFQTATGTWRDLTVAQAQGADVNYLFPRVFVAPDGRVAQVGPDQDTWFLDTTGAGSWTQGPNKNFPGDRSYGGSVMYAPGKILMAGGGDPPTATAEVLDLNSPNPSWRSAPTMNYPRQQMNATILPDGKVLVTGGTSAPGFSNPTGAVFPAEVWDPASETWSVLPAQESPRLYHSTSFLLPDGRVVSAGGGYPGLTLQNNAEIYSPAYLFNGARPRITAAPDAIGYGQSFQVLTPNAAGIASVSLVRLPSVTHAFDMNQRFVPLSFTAGAGSLTVTAPAGGTLAPPGHYMLFILNKKGVPSVAKIVQLALPTASHFDVAVPPGATAGDSFNITVTALNAFGQVDPGYTGTVHFTSSDPKAVLPADYTFSLLDQGVHTFTGVVLTKAGAQSVTAVDTVNDTIVGSGVVQVQAGAATHFNFAGPSSATAGTPFTVSLTALDAFGNVAKGYTGTVHFSSSDPSATLPADYTFGAADNGRHTFTNGVTLATIGKKAVTTTDTADPTLQRTRRVTVNAPAAPGGAPALGLGPDSWDPLAIDDYFGADPADRRHHRVPATVRAR